MGQPAACLGLTVSQRTTQLAPAAERPIYRRSRVTNGKQLHVDRPGDNKWARRFADVLGEIVSDLGGLDHLSEGQRQLARRAATLSIEAEKAEGRAVKGEPFDIESYCALTSALIRTFARLGLKRVARNVEPTLADILRPRNVASEAAE
jgi:hypothetical protein